MQPRIRFVCRGGWALGCLVLALQTGCQSLIHREATWSGSAKDMWGGMTLKKDEKIVFEEPHQLAVIWSDSAVVGQDGSPIRGFSGRVYFNNAKNKPARVEGELTVYAYDDTSAGTKTTADRVYKFREEELQSHFSPSGIGPSYSFWIPWDQVGGERRSIALVPVFKSKEGKVVSGDQSLNTLPGKATAQDEQKKRISYYVAGSSPAVVSGGSAVGTNGVAAMVPDTSSVQQVAHFQPAENTETGKPRTTTFDLPRTMAARMQGHQVPVAAGSEMTVNNSDGSSATVSYGPAEKVGFAGKNSSGAESAPAVTIQSTSLTPGNMGNGQGAGGSAGASRSVYGKPGSIR